MASLDLMGFQCGEIHLVSFTTDVLSRSSTCHGGVYKVEAMSEYMLFEWTEHNMAIIVYLKFS
jgi:hypothetical protein